MSLSFVKSAVLSSTDGISHNEETAIDNSETQSLRASSGAGFQKPLFEQLRANKEVDQEKEDEFQRSIRGTRPLDEEDCAHLDNVDRRREEVEFKVKSGIEQEVALFHAAREDRGLAQTVVMEGDGDDADKVVRGDAAVKAGVEPIAAVAKKEMKKIVPKFTIKKKRKRVVAQESDSNNNSAEKNKLAGPKNKSNDTRETKGSKESDVDGNKPSSKATNDSDSDNEGGGLLGLGCYGSDSD
mmetsp:Transcript_42866/g.77072  ORF Transcript_42866/g.77072 Transcript_42866/m.77072 type:complete len:241 (-) Transcript_42866:76-798(-)